MGLSGVSCFDKSNQLEVVEFELIIMLFVRFTWARLVLGLRKCVWIQNLSFVVESMDMFDLYHFILVSWVDVLCLEALHDH